MQYTGPYEEVWSALQKKKWYDHRSEPATENEHVKLLWDFTVQKDRTIEARRPDLILIDKTVDECKIIDVAVLGDTRVVKKEEEKKSTET